jgi:hypothetical protein
MSLLKLQGYEISDGKMKHVEVDGKEVLNDLSLFLFFTRIQ